MADGNNIEDAALDILRQIDKAYGSNLAQAESSTPTETNVSPSQVEATATRETETSQAESQQVTEDTDTGQDSTASTAKTGEPSEAAHDDMNNNTTEQSNPRIQVHADKELETTASNPNLSFDIDDQSTYLQQNAVNESRVEFQLFGFKISRPAREYISYRSKNESSDWTTGSHRITLFIHFADDSIPYQTIVVKAKATCKAVLDSFAETIDCRAPDYFGFCERYEDGTERWLELDLALDEQDVQDKTHLIFKVKLFKLPKYNLDGTSLDLFFIQIKKSVISGDYFLPERIALLLAALNCQIKLGNFDSMEKLEAALNASIGNFLPPEYVRTTTVECWIKRIARVYKRLYGLSTNDAKWAYLLIAKQLPAFGAHFFPVKQGKLNVTLGIVEDGLLIFKNDKRTDMEFVPFHNIKEYAATADGIMLRMCSQPDPQLDPIIIKVRYTCSALKARTISMLLDTYASFYPFDQFPDRQSKLSPSPPPLELSNLYQPIVPRPVDIFMSKLDYLVYNYRVACLLDHTTTYDPLIEYFDRNFFLPNKQLQELDLRALNLSGDTLSRLARALEKSESYSKSTYRSTNNVNINTLRLDNVMSGNLGGILKPLANCMTVLDLSSISIPKLDYDALGAALQAATVNIQEFYFRNNGLSDKTAPKVLAPFVNHKNLKLLDLSDNKISNCDTLVEVIATCSQMEVLCLDGNKISESSIESIVSAIKASNCTLKSLGLQRNNFGSKSAAVITDLIKEKRIQRLLLGGNDLGKSAAEKLAAALANDSSLTAISLGGNDFQKGWKELFNTFPTCKRLTRLELTHSCDKYAWQYLSSMLAENNRFLSLSFRSNTTFCTHGLPLLQEPLKTVSLLRMLDLSDTNITKKEIAYVCDALKQNKSITWLDLSNNKLGDDGIAILGNILAVNTTLLRLNLDSNRIGSYGSKELAEAIQRARPSNLQYLSLANNRIELDGLDAWLTALRNPNVSLLNLDFTNNPADVSAGKYREWMRLPTQCITLLPWI